MKIQKFLFVAIVFSLEQGVRGQFNPDRCYTCRSRGERGDCRDTFIRPTPAPLDLDPNSPAPYQPAVDETPCYTGWCAKIIEDVTIESVISEDYSIATERQCMTRAPSDNKERCAYVVYRGKQVFMCFCKGDLCNSAPTALTTMSFIMTAIILSCLSSALHLIFL